MSVAACRAAAAVKIYVFKCFAEALEGDTAQKYSNRDGEYRDPDSHSQLALSNGALIIAHGGSVSEVETKGKHALGQDQHGGVGRSRNRCFVFDTILTDICFRCRG